MSNFDRLIKCSLAISYMYLLLYSPIYVVSGTQDNPVPKATL